MNKSKCEVNEMKQIIEIEDTLKEEVEGVKEEIKEDFISYLEENPDMRDFDDYYQNQECDRIHEICDSSTPIYYNDIDGIYYLYSAELDEAYKNAGIGDGREDNYKQIAIYCYLSEEGFEYMNELQKEFEMWDEEKPLKGFIKQLKEK